MASKRLSVFVVAAVLSATVAVLGSGDGDDKTLRQIAGYREWTRQTEKPIRVNSFIATAA